MFVPRALEARSTCYDALRSCRLDATWVSHWTWAPACRLALPVVPRRTTSLVTGMTLSSHLESPALLHGDGSSSLEQLRHTGSGGSEHQVSAYPFISADKMIGGNESVHTHISLRHNELSSSLLCLRTCKQEQTRLFRGTHPPGGCRSGYTHSLTPIEIRLQRLLSQLVPYWAHTLVCVAGDRANTYMSSLFWYVTDKPAR